MAAVMLMDLRNLPLRRKLMAVLLMTSGAVVAFTCVLFFAYEFLTFRRTTVSQLATLGEAIASNSTAALAFASREDAEQVLSALRADPHIVAGAIYTEDGRLFASYPPAIPTDSLPIAPRVDGTRFGREGLVLFHPIARDGKRLGTLYLRSDLGAIHERLWLYSVMVLFVIGGSFTLAYLVSRKLQHQISHPILALEETTRAISERGDFSVRAAKDGDDEVGRLTDAFNRMLEQIQQLNRDLEQRVRERTAELESANQELEAFSYSVSHDLRAPLRHIAGFAAMLEDHVGGALDEKGRRYLGIIQSSTKRMGQLIDDLLAFSRHGRAELRRGPVKLDELIAQIRQGFEADLAARRVVWDVAPLPILQGDTALLRQVFTNLLSNALKYSRQRAETRIEIGVQAGGSDEAVVFVRDNGAGFDMKYADKLFGVFQRLHQQDEFEGTGVGLATVRRIIQRHGGRVWAEGRVQEGATFYVALPVLEPAQSTPPFATVSL